MTENVNRGTVFALLAIPASIVAFGFAASFSFFIVALAALVIPSFAAWLYAKGAGTPLSRAGWGPYIGVSATAIVVGVVSAIIGGTYAGYLGKEGPFSAAFLRTLGNQFTENIGDTVLTIVIGLAVGAVAIAGVLRGPRTPGARNPGLVATATPEEVPPVTPPAASTPPAANAPSPGVILNGKPIDPHAK